MKQVIQSQMLKDKTHWTTYKKKNTRNVFSLSKTYIHKKDVSHLALFKLDLEVTSVVAFCGKT